MSAEGTPAPVPAAQPQPAVARDLTQPPVGSQVPTSATIPLTVGEYQRLIAVEASLAQLKAEQQAAIEAKEQEKLRALAEKGQVEEVFTKHRELWEAKVAEQAGKYNALEASLLSEKKAATLSASFAGRTFAGESPEQQSIAAGQLRQLLESQFEAVRDPATGAIAVRDKASLRPAADAVREALASPMYAHFFAPTSRGGTGFDGSRPPAAQQETKPGTLEDIAAKYRAARGGSGFGMFGVAQ